MPLLDVLAYINVEYMDHVFESAKSEPVTKYANKQNHRSMKNQGYGKLFSTKNEYYTFAKYKELFSAKHEILYAR